MALDLYEDYTRRAVHDLFEPDSPFTPGAGKWGLQGIVQWPDRPHDFAFFVSFGRLIGQHRFDEGVTTDGVLIGQVDQWRDAAEAVRSWMSHLLPPVFWTEHRYIVGGGPPGGSLALMLALLLHGIHLNRAGGVEPGVGQAYIGVVLSSPAESPAESWAQLLSDDDFVDVLWSVILASGALDGSRELVQEAARRISPWLDLSEQVAESYVRRFIAGLLLAAGESIDEVETTIERLTPDDWWHDRGSDLHIGPLGRANSCNRNRTMHYADVPDVVNGWATETFPAFGPP